MKKIIRKVEFADFNLNKNKTGSFNQVKSVKVSNDHELLLQIANGLKNVQADIQTLKSDVQTINTRLDKQDEFNREVSQRLTKLESR
ncbi:MAG: hypothetical protein LBF36_02320 [Mycoplasmataceae bacterium]|jgi:peptidoglycan hydrolase CwlO-like protein|nr:hypothetical protein [Mycoplasmataceae bacterium]